MTEIRLRPYQEQAIKGIQEKFKSGIKKVVLVACMGAGKSCCKDTPILMYDGSVKMVQDIVQGDIVMGDDSTPRNVLSTSVGVEPCYEITPIKGMKWRCNESHILTLKKYKKIPSKEGVKYTSEIIDINLKDYLLLTKYQKYILKQIRVPVNFNKLDLNIDPYFLGVWLGDGDCAKISVTNPDIEIRDYINEFSSVNSFTFKEKFVTKNVICYRFNFNKTENIKLYEAFNRYNLINNKHIPKDFLVNSRDNRLKLLAGLLDTDGHYHHHHGYYEITTKYKQLKDDICFLAGSLGYSPTWTYGEKQIKSIAFKGMYYRIMISGDMIDLPLLIHRKKPQPRKQKKDVLCTGFSVNPIGDQEYFGIELDGNHRFLLGDFTVTHNTVIASKMIKMALENNTRVLFLAHRKELIMQCYNKLKQFGVEAGIIMAGVKENRSLKVQVASIQTLSRRELPLAKLLIIDECHNSISKTYLDLLRRYEEEQNSFFCGLTATPFRLSKKEYLGLFYEDFVYPISTEELIKQEFLVPTRVFASSRIVSTHFKKRGEDYDEKELLKAFDTDDLRTNLLNNIIAHIGNRKTIIFCCNVEHSIKTTQFLRDNGYTAEHADGTTDPITRDRLIREFREGKFQFLSNINIFSEGLDVPEISAVILNLATASKVKYLQAAGRGLRLAENKKDCIILDFADNTLKFGFAEQSFDIDIHNQIKIKKGVPATKECPKCNRIVSASAKTCIECGYVFPVKVKEKKKPEEELFEELDRKMVKAEAYRYHPKEKWHEIPTELLGAFAKIRGFHRGWVNHELARRKEGRKIVKILGYTEKDYWKQKNWLEKAYYDKIPIDAHTWQFVEETEINLIFKYKLNEEERKELTLF
jgi:superfamily II DNA or RNA helicase